MAVVGLILVVLCFVLPGLYLVRRFRRGDEASSGGSLGDQTFGRDKSDWGPKSP
jgi:flagellar biogenesis protein FliO